MCIRDRVYPVYVDTNVMAGRAGDYVEGKGWSKIVYMPCKEENGFLPEIPQQPVDMIYLCFPNNPSGVGITKEALEKWVDYALENQSILLYDAAYEAFITDPDMPHSIFEIEGAKKCAIEFRSFSKTAGFTGTRCAFSVIPKELEYDGVSLNKPVSYTHLWGCPSWLWSLLWGVPAKRVALRALKFWNPREVSGIGIAGWDLAAAIF